MSPLLKYAVAALAIAIAAHFAVIVAIPNVLMGAALDRVSGGRYNQWRIADRVTPASRGIVRPAPDFAYSVCPYDLADGPILLRVSPWNAYWSLSLYAANSDNFFVIDDREVRNGAQVTLVRAGAAAPKDAERVVRSPSRHGVALIRRLAPTAEAYAGAVRAAKSDVCARFVG